MKALKERWCRAVNLVLDIALDIALDFLDGPESEEGSETTLGALGLSSWDRFVLAIIQVETGGEPGVTAQVPYRVIRDKSLAYEAEYTGSQKIKATFDLLSEEGYITRHRRGSRMYYEQHVFVANPHRVLLTKGEYPA